MLRWLLCCAAVLLWPAAAPAHFIWVVPESPTGPQAKVVFSDNLEPDQILAKRWDHLARTEFRVRDTAGKVAPLTLRRGGEDFGRLEVPGEGFRVVGGKVRWGVHVLKERGETTPFLIYYYPKAVMGSTPAEALTRPWDWLKAEIVPRVEKDALRLQVLYKGQPAKTELRVLFPNETKVGAYRTNARGEFKVRWKGPGTYAVWARAGTEPTPGEHEGREYDEVRHYPSLVLTVGAETTGVAK